MPIIKNESSFYIRCEDKPWENDTTMRNRNSESKALNLKRTPKLEIVSAKPDNETLTFGTPVASIKVEAETKGGMITGSMCYASFDEKNYLVVLDPSLDGIEHEVIMQSFTPGNKKIGLKCEDEIGNTAYKNLSFRVDMDDRAPDIARVYYNTGRLYVKTNEPAECSISREKCDFNLENATSMSGSDREHSSDVILNRLYYIKCKDKFNNNRGSCDITIKAI